MRNRMKDRKGKADGEAGYLLLAVIFMTAVLLISLAVAAPKIARQIQRDKDIETIHRGEQYKRAIREYYNSFGAYPTSFDQLKETNNIRFLRKEYADPLTGKVDWKPVYYGQAHVRPLGFFGQPLSSVAGVGAASVVMGGASAGMYAISSTTTTDENGIPVAGDSSSGGAAGTGPGMSSGSDNGSGSGFGSGSSNGFGSGSSGFGSSGFGGSNGLGGSSGTGLGSSGIGQPGSGYGSSGNGLSGFQSNGSTPGGNSNSGFGSTNSTSASGPGGSTFGGGGPIVGVTLTLNKPSLVDYKLQTRYNKWEFNYDPMEDQMMAASSLFGGSSVDANSTGTSTGNMPNGFGNSNGLGGSNNGFGNSNGLGGSNNGFGGNNGLGGSNGGSGLGGSNPNGSSGSGGTNPPGGSSNPQ